MKKLIFLGVCATVALALTSCGGGDVNEDVDNVNNGVNSTNPNPGGSSNVATYPLSETVVFRTHSLNNVFKLSDGSAWQITGSSNSEYNTGRITSKVIIYKATASTPNPVIGTRSDYYLVGDGIKPSFYIKPLLMKIMFTGSVNFNSQSTNDIFKLSDGSAWQIMGISSENYLTGKLTSNVVIYAANNNTPNPVRGIKSAYYLIGDGVHPAFYIRPIN